MFNDSDFKHLLLMVPGSLATDPSLYILAYISYMYVGYTYESSCSIELLY